MKKAPAVLVYDAKPHDREFLGAQAGIDWRFSEARLNPASAALAKGCASACIFVNDDASAASLAALKKAGLRNLALRSAGYNHLDLGALRRLGLKAVRVPAYSPHAVAEHAVALLLALNRRIHRAHLRVMEHDFSLHGLMGFDLHGKCVGLLGTGKIGRVAAKIFRGFGCEVLAADPLPDKDWARQAGVRYVPLESMLRQSDVVSLHAPLTHGTHHLMNARRLSWMKPSAILVNTGRGKLVDTKALIWALKKGRLAGVALDVYEEEEGVFFEDLSSEVMADDQLARLISFPNVLLTAHQGFFTREALLEIARVTSENLLRLSAGRAPLQGTELK